MRQITNSEKAAMRDYAAKAANIDKSNLVLFPIKYTGSAGTHLNRLLVGEDSFPHGSIIWGHFTEVEADEDGKASLEIDVHERLGSSTDPVTYMYVELAPDSLTMKVHGVEAEVMETLSA